MLDASTVVCGKGVSVVATVGVAVAVGGTDVSVAGTGVLMSGVEFARVPHALDIHMIST